MRSLVMSAWLCLFAVFLAEHSIGPVIAAVVNLPVSPDEPITHYNQTDPFGDFFILPNSKKISAPIPDVREPFFNCQTFLPERSIDPFSCIHIFPELVQDIWRCPAVAIVLFPYHEFL